MKWYLTPAVLILSALILSPAAIAQTTASGPGTLSFVTKAVQGQYRASKIIGVRIYNDSNEDIGNVNDVIVDNKGSVIAVVIGVGGFLGIGEKNVAMPFNAVAWSDTSDQTQPVTSPGTTSPLASPPTTATTPPATTPPTAVPAAQGTKDYPSRGVLELTKEQLHNAPEFKFASDTAN